MKLVVDVENTVITRDGKLHLDPYEPTNTLTMVGIGDANGSGEPTVFTFDHAEMQPDSADKLQRLLEDASLLIMHNAQHDLQWLWGCGFKFDSVTNTEKNLSKKTKIKASVIPNAKFKPIPPLFLKDATATANIVKIITEIGMVILLFFSNIWLFRSGDPLFLSLSINLFNSKKFNVFA